MDSLDLRLISLLRENARMSVADLAKSLTVSRGTVQNRIDKLVEQRLGSIELAGVDLEVRMEADGAGETIHEDRNWNGSKWRTTGTDGCPQAGLSHGNANNPGFD